MSKKQILIVSKDESLRGGLAALVRSIPNVGNVTQVSSPTEALRQVEEIEPDLIVLDTAESYLDLLKDIQSMCPSVKSLLLVEGMRQQTQAQVAGVDVALIKGYPAHELIETVQALLSRRD